MPVSGGMNSASGMGAFRYRDFRLYWLARILALVAAEMQITTVGWQVYRMTGRELDLGLIGLAQFAPFALLFLVSGLVADRLPRLRILAGCMCVQMICATAFLLLARAGASFDTMLLVLVLLGIARAFQMPALAAVLPTLVPAQVLANAIAWSSSGNQAARIAGPTVAGLGIALGEAFELGETPVYAAVVALFGLGLSLMLAVRSRGQVLNRDPISIATLTLGLRFIWSRQVILGAIGLDLLAVLFGGAIALLPVYARDILQVGSEGFGLLRSSYTVGGLAGALLLTQVPIRRHAGAKLLVAVAVFGLSIIVFGASTSFLLSLAALFVMGAADSISVYVRSNLVQVITPDDMRGRVGAVNGVFIGASNELGEFESGVTAHWWGTVPAVVIGGAITVGVVALFALVFPRLRGVDSLDPDDLVRRYRGSP